MVLKKGQLELYNDECINCQSQIARPTEARFNKEVQPTLSLNLNSELTYPEMGNSEFSVSERLNCVS